MEATDLNLLASLPQAPIPPHEFVTLTDCYVEPPQPPTSVAPSIEDQDLVKDHSGGGGGGNVYNPEYISL